VSDLSDLPKVPDCAILALQNSRLLSVVEEDSEFSIPSLDGNGAFAPGIQASDERSMNLLLPMLSWPDLIVGAGLMGG
jgi:hypothetical protein